jgi:hypothetical protein
MEGGDNMLTNDQLAVYHRMAESAPTELLPPRYLTDSDDVTALLVARVLTYENDPELGDLVDCECGRDHVQYHIVMPDGFSPPAIISNTFGEDLMIPPNLRWDGALPVEPHMWPAEGIAELEGGDFAI